MNIVYKKPIRTYGSVEMILTDACFQKVTPYTPVWLMRQAGRYMKEYRDLRAKVSFLELCKSPELAAETTLFACKTINADAAIIFADILLITESLGFDLEFVKNHGPIIHNPFTPKHVFPKSDITSSYSYLDNAIRLTRKDLPKTKALIGFAGAPFTVATYCIEGGKSKDFKRTFDLITQHPDQFDRLLSHITDATIDYLKIQIDAGADCLQLFDSWVGILDAPTYEKHVLNHVKKIIERLNVHKLPLIYFGTRSEHLLPSMLKAQPTVIGLDSDTSIETTWPRIGFHPIQGNLNPKLLLEDFSLIQKETQGILDQVQRRPGYIFNLGHGILPQTPVDHVIRLIAYVQEKTAG